MSRLSSSQQKEGRKRCGWGINPPVRLAALFRRPFHSETDRSLRAVNPYQWRGLVVKVSTSGGTKTADGAWYGKLPVFIVEYWNCKRRWINPVYQVDQDVILEGPSKPIAPIHRQTGRELLEKEESRRPGGLRIPFSNGLSDPQEVVRLTARKRGVGARRRKMEDCPAEQGTGS